MSRDDQDCPSPTLSVSSVDSEDSVLLTPPLQLDEYQDGWDWNPPQRPPAGAIASRDIHTGLTPRLMSVSLRVSFASRRKLYLPVLLDLRDDLLCTPGHSSVSVRSVLYVRSPVYRCLGV